MGEIISFVGHKGGTGKSTLARAFAVEAAKRDNRVLIADLDDSQRTSWEWGQRRAANQLLPLVNVEVLPRLRVFTRAADIDMLIVDAPAWADASSLWLAQGSQLTVLATGAGVDDLNPTIRLMHQLMNNDVADWRVAMTLNRIHSDAEATFAHDYLKQARYRALDGQLSERKAYADLHNIGRAVTEGPAALSREALELVDGIARALERSQRKTRALEREAGPARLIRSKDKDRGDR